jgi:predicted O-methyltransferase YrrM
MKFTVVFNEYAQQSITRLVAKYGVPKVVIEIGLFEGNTTFNLAQEMVKHYPEYKHYAIDPYGVSADLPNDVVNEAEVLFKANLAEFEHKASIEFMQMTSHDALLELYTRGVKADLIYVDGDHRASTVLEDLVMGYNLLKEGGIMLCDDCIAWRHERLQDNPKLAVDSFINCYWDKVVVEQLDNGYQIAIRKI